MSNFRFLIVFTTLIFATLSPGAWAVLDLHVQEPLPVYDVMTGSGREVSTLVKGDVVVISPKVYGRYRKVLVTYDGKRRAGYVVADKIVRSFIKDRDEEERVNSEVSDYKRSTGFGLSLIGSYLMQGARKLTTSDGSNYEISNMTSFTLFFSIFYDYPFRDRWVLRPYLTFRQTKFKGDASLTGLITTTNPRVTISQNLLGLGLLAKRYSDASSSFWYGGAIEVAKGSSVNVEMSSAVTLDKNDESLPFFAVLQGVAGVDIALGRSGLFLLPDVRLGVIPNTNPYILMFETFLSTSYAF